MKLDAANRNLLALVALPFGVLGLLNVGLLVLIAQAVVTGGLATLAGQGPGQDLRPALGLMALVLAATGRAGWSLRSQLRANRRLEAHVASLRDPELEQVAAAGAGTELAGRVDVLDDARPFSFTYRLRSPRVAVSRGLVDSTTPSELEAVLAHEAYHVKNHDTLKVLLARALPGAFFYLPALGDLRRRYLAGRELAADREATACCGRAAMAGALFKAVGGPEWSRAGASAAMAGPELLEARVSQLETGREPPLPPLSRRALVLTIVDLFLLFTAFAVTVGELAGYAGDHMHALASLGIVGAFACPGVWAWGAWALYRRLFVPTLGDGQQPGWGETVPAPLSN